MKEKEIVAWNCTDNTNTCTNRITIRKYRKTKKLSTFAALQQYSNIVNPIATGLPVQTSSTQTQANPITTAMGGALIGSKFGGVGAGIGAGLGFLGGLL